ncbi:MAG TPA: alpha/beta hydrolase [Longimicrobiaceae bacterium]|nr:alpha/beta hydrolase [Longimicrobiaceae bacterium]
MSHESSTAEPGLALTRWEIRPRDGQPPIRGEVRLPAGTAPRSAVVVCHGFKGFRTWGFFPPLARALARAGHAAVTFDFSRNGVGADGVDFSALERFRENTHTRDVDEVRMVLDALGAGGILPRAPLRVGLFGHSRGGGEAVLAAAEDVRVDALVTWAAISDIPARWTEEQVAAWRRGETVEIANSRTGQMMPVGPAYWRDVEMNRERLDVLRAASALTIPWLIVHGEDDATVPAAEGQALFDAAGEDAELLLVEGAGHTFGAAHPYAGATPELRAVVEATVEWYGTHLR